MRRTLNLVMEEDEILPKLVGTSWGVTIRLTIVVYSVTGVKKGFQYVHQKAEGLQVLGLCETWLREKNTGFYQLWMWTLIQHEGMVPVEASEKSLYYYTRC